MTDDENDTPSPSPENGEPSTDELILLVIAMDEKRGKIFMPKMPGNSVLALGMANYARLKIEEMLFASTPPQSQITRPKLMIPPGIIGGKH